MPTISAAVKSGCVSLLLPLLAAGQGIEKLSKETLQFHGFFSQGYAISDHNNYLTMNTSGGTAQMTDGGLNVTLRLNSKLRVGVQVYDRYIGDLGKGRVSLDWALVDYRFRDWLGFRAGKVKTPLGLFTDSQDQEFLYPWALLPQSVYPLDLREASAAHNGGDLYGEIDVPRVGHLAYQMYAGTVSPDYRTGFLYGVEDLGYKNLTYSARTAGYDLRWTPPVSGLMVGVSQSFAPREFEAELRVAPIRVSAKTYFSRQTALYIEFARGRWRFNAEQRRLKLASSVRGLPGVDRVKGGTTGWFAALSFRVSPRVEIGGYRSQYRDGPTPGVSAPGVNIGPGANHIDDTTVTVRFDPTRYWNIKVEGHFIDGYGNVLSARGFYPRYHPRGIQPRTNLLVLRTGFTF